MDLGIAGERALVLGGTKGLAYSAAKFLAAAGVKLVVNGRDAGAGRDAAAALGAAFVQGDVTEAKALPRIHDEAKAAAGGAFAILVTNAGGPPPGQFLDHDDDAWGKALEANMLSAIRIIRRMLPAMIARGWGRIVNITSFAVREPYSNLVLSNGVRAGLTGAMSTLAREVAERGVTVNNVLPGLMDTGALQRVYRAQSLRFNISEDEAKRRMANPHFSQVILSTGKSLAGYVGSTRRSIASSRAREVRRRHTRK